MRWAVLVLMLGGCNALLGIHEIDVDAAPPDVDPCTGLCECREDADCTGAHRVCDDQISSRECVCAAGYTDGDGTCTWTGVVADPGFSTSTTWTVTNPAILDPTATIPTGVLDPGMARFTFACNQQTLPGTVGQPLLMPRYSRAEPLVAAISFNVTNNSWQSSDIGALGIGPVWYPQSLSFVFNNRWGSSRRCLGAAQYAPESSRGRGTGVPLQLTALPIGGFFCGGPRDTLYDRVEIVPATALDNCPLPGTVTNGDAEGTGGWVFAVSGSSTAQIVAGVGENNSNGVRLAATQRCAQPKASVPVSVPLPDATGGPALSVFHSKTSGVTLSIRFGGRTLVLSGAANQKVTDRYCLPPTMHGAVLALEAIVDPAQPAGSMCADAINVNAVVDSVSVVNDPLCPVGNGVTDPGFESGLSLMDSGAGGTGSVMIANDATAHGGARDLQLTVRAQCDSAIASLQVVTPDPPAGTGAAVTFSYRYPADTTTTLVTTAPANKPAFTPVRNQNFNDGIICLQPQYTPGLEQPVVFSLATSGTTCGLGLGSPGVLTVDDVRVTFDPLCAP